MVQEADTDSDSLVEVDFTWTVQRVTRDTITIQLKFAEPILVSSGGRINHMVIVTVPEASQFLFISSTGMQVDPQYYTLMSPIPKQDTLELAMQEALQSAATATTLAFSGSGIIQVLIGGSL